MSTTAPDPTATTEPVAPPPAPVGPRRLVRTPDDTMVGGVCGGIARYLNVDVTLVRVLSVVVGVFAFPLPLVAYVALWVIMPKG